MDAPASLHIGAARGLPSAVRFCPERCLTLVDRVADIEIGGSKSDGLLWRRGSDQFIALPSRLVTTVGHSADRVSDTEIGGVRKVTSGTGDVNPTTGSISPAVNVECCMTPGAECVPAR